MVARLAHAAAAYVAARSYRQHHIDGLDLGQFFKYPSRLIAQAGGFAHLTQRFPHHIRKEAHQYMSLHTLGFLMPDGTYFQIAFMNPERSLASV